MRLFLFLALIFLIYYVLKAATSVFSGPGDGSRASSKARDRGQETWDELVKDPSCGVYVPKRDAIRHMVGGREVFFCSNECKDRFLEREKGDR